MDMTFCTDKKCLRKVCHRHPSHIPSDLDMPVAFSPFTDCEQRLRMIGDEVEEVEHTGCEHDQVADSCSCVNSNCNWPSSVRIDAIGLNGNEGLHYDK